MGQACADAGSWAGFSVGVVRLDYDSGTGVLVAELVVGNSIDTATAAQWAVLRDYHADQNWSGFVAAASSYWSSLWGQLTSAQQGEVYDAVGALRLLGVDVHLRHHNGQAQIETSSPGLAAGDGAAILAGTGTQAAFDSAVGSSAAGQWHAAQGAILRAAMRQMVMAAL